MVVVNVHSEADSSYTLSKYKKILFFLLLVLVGDHFFNLFFPEESVQCIVSGREFGNRSECRLLFAEKENGSAFNSFKPSKRFTGVPQWTTLIN